MSQTVEIDINTYTTFVALNMCTVRGPDDVPTIATSLHTPSNRGDPSLEERLTFKNSTVCHEYFKVLQDESLRS